MKSAVEKWLPVSSKYGKYEISSFGRVRGKKLLKPTPNRAGYLRVCLCDKGKKTYKPVHQLVLEAFVGPRPWGFHAGHIDDDHSNNALANLRWMSPAENFSLKKKNGKIPRFEKHQNAKLSNADVSHIRKNYVRGLNQSKRGNCRKLAKKFKVHPQTIIRIAAGKSWVPQYADDKKEEEK